MDIKVGDSILLIPYFRKGKVLYKSDVLVNGRPEVRYLVKLDDSHPHENYQCTKDGLINITGNKLLEILHGE